MTTAPRSVITDVGAVAAKLEEQERAAAVDRTLLLADLIAGYTLLASWQAKHRGEFPGHSCTGQIEARDDTDAGYQFGASLSANPLHAERFSLYVTGYGSTVREAVESAIAGANTVVAENRSAWS